MSDLTNTSCLRNLNLKLHLITENVISHCFLLKIHCRIMSLCLQEYTIPKIATPYENSKIWSFQSLFGGNGLLYLKCNETLEPQKLDDCHRRLRSHLHWMKNVQKDNYCSQNSRAIWLLQCLSFWNEELKFSNADILQYP